jgi:hypothetical protein
MRSFVLPVAAILAGAGCNFMYGGDAFPPPPGYGPGEAAGGSTAALLLSDVTVEGRAEGVDDLTLGTVTDASGYIVTNIGCPDLMAEVRIQGETADRVPFDLVMGVNLHGVSEVDQISLLHGHTIRQESWDDYGEYPGAYVDEESYVSELGHVFVGLEVTEFEEAPELTYYAPTSQDMVVSFARGKIEGAHRLAFEATLQNGDEVRGSLEMSLGDEKDLHYVRGFRAGTYGVYHSEEDH